MNLVDAINLELDCHYTPSKSSGVAIDRDQAIKPNLSPVFELQKICLVRIHPQSDPELGRFLQLQR